MSQNQAESETIPTFAVSATAENDTKTTVETRGFEFVVDEPPVFGGDDDGPNPVEYLIGSWAGCLNVVCHIVADEMEIEIRDLAFDIEGELDPAKLLGTADDSRAGYREIRATVLADVDADDETVREWLEAVEERCPVADNVANPTPIEISVTTR